ncbi:MAG: hypothetical protein KDC46_12595 [Thermoleophilia bacterium]|nr:hypothetical protein [Thermoleophilia bacterium]
MSKETPTTARSRDHLRLVSTPPLEAGTPPAARPRTIGRVIAQTALIADSAVTRRRLDDRTPDAGRGMAGRLLGRFR